MLSAHFFHAGFCRHCQKMTLKGGTFKKIAYPSLCVLIRHPHFGAILYDTGYSLRFIESTNHFPERLYRWITPVTLTLDLKTQLETLGISACEINYIIISHFHADHLGGLKDFPNAQFICHPQAWDSVKNIGRFNALTKAFLPQLLPTDFNPRLKLLELQHTINLNEQLLPFISGYDLFGDNSLIAIDLPGHAPGHIGLLFANENHENIFLVGDSCWHRDTFQAQKMPSSVTKLIHYNNKEYQHTIQKLHQLHKQNQTIKIIPSHCNDSAKMLWGTS